MSTRSTVALLVAICSLLLAPGSHAAEIEGTEATLEWTAADGPVSGYYVIVSRNDAPAQVEAVSLDTLEVVEAAVGDTLTVQVAAFADDGVAGPVSPPSDPITFVSGDGGGDGSDGGDGSGGGSGGGGSGGGGSGGGGSGGGGTDPVRAIRSDLTGDGFADLLVRTETTLEIWALRGSHVEGTILLPLPPAGAKLAAIGDFDANGSADLLWQLADTALELWSLDGGVVTDTLVLDRSTAPSADGWKVAGTGDFDADGSDDLLLHSARVGEAQVGSPGASGIAELARFSDVPSRWDPQVVAGAGNAAIVWHDTLDGSLHLSTFAGDVLFLGDVGTGWSIVEAADLDGLGAAEVILEDAVSGALQAWTLASGSLTMLVEIPSGPDGAARAAVGDFDGDGREDLAWSEVAPGSVTLHYADGFAEESVDRQLPAGAVVLGPGDDASAGSAPCEGDLDGDGVANGKDRRHLRACLRLGLVAGCEGADLNADGVLDTTDLAIFKDLTRGSACE